MGNREAQDIRRYVDMWALPGIHPSNVEFLQKLKTADTNHFTTNMDVVGTRLNGKQSKVLEGLLSDDDVMKMQSGDIQKRRLVLKLFKTTGTRVRW